MLAVGGLVWVTGCASIGPPLPPSLELPHPPSDLRAARKGDRVRLTWTVPARTTDRQSVRYLGKTQICRSVDAPLASCGMPVGEVEPQGDFAAVRKPSQQKMAATFTDTLPAAIEEAHPAGFAIYAIEVLNAAGRSAGISNQVRVPLIPTVPPFSNFAAHPSGQGVLISWRCPPMSRRGAAGTKYLFRIYRRSESNARKTTVAEIDQTDCSTGLRGVAGLSNEPSATTSNAAQGLDEISTSFLDQSFEWENTYFYHGAVVSVMEMAGQPPVEVEGDDTPEVKVFAHDVFPPAVPSGLQAVFSGLGQQAFIDLIWAPVVDSDLDGYNVFRREEGGEPIKVNSELVKAPAFRDTQVAPGKRYFYSVSAVDLRGNESARSEEAGESVPENL